ncbi:aromatic acid exporter family protein [Aeribacillus composti]|uniref:aromatic acid exporter family protein n=1 Tax=Aeribacillus composti TaxID=1868734 RepID=UPI002E1D7798|nr:aromatic acid exporter family protein [Aeribacillus composti]
MRKFKIGYRTLKTAIGAPLAIFLAQLMDLNHFVSTGIIAILCIQVTKKKSLKSAWSRFFACITGMMFSFLFFEIFGYHPIVIGFLLLFFIPTMVLFKTTEGIVTSAVIILHLYEAGQITLDIVQNELLIIVTGIGVALLMNLYMPSLENDLNVYRKEVEKNFAVIFEKIVAFLREGDYTWDGKEIPETADLIEKGKGLALRNVENRLLRHEDQYYAYFKMREKQFEIIERVLPTFTMITANVEQAHLIAQFIDELKDNIHSGNTAKKFLKKLDDIKKEMERAPLPKTRKEFETRARLYHFLYEMEQYLIIKSQFKGLADAKKGKG